MSKVVTLSEAASIALHGIVLIARSEGMINVTNIAEATATSRHHVAKVLQRLVKVGYLYSHRGPTGGFSLKKKPAEITLLELYETIEGKIEITECPLDKPICAFGKCLLENKANQMTIEFRDFLNSKTVADYIK
ncbi:MAG: Rrf2 family transcriptional regulator [Bacteroidetes bacterium GWF2_38_335]|nr:MAG: Rrf2 family transcriptional regulator [Bacteroidetes bacterium GWF2_38_335]OFY76975.1 MAG: Rrf2 family transcriptional regulator [Bacteroidetes bacterium RIFOXYA12_FULL_38_20]HBS86830.1 Rrf2 family transcriptional regulator [Bacteroidales bacterium]